MEQDGPPGPQRVQDGRGDRGRCHGSLPFASPCGPQHRRQVEGTAREEDFGVEHAVRRAVPVERHSADVLNGIPRVAELPGQAGGWHGQGAVVRPAMEGQFVPFSADPTDQPGVGDGSGPEHKEGRLPLVLGEKLEERRCAGRVLLRRQALALPGWLSNGSNRTPSAMRLILGPGDGSLPIVFRHAEHNGQGSVGKGHPDVVTGDTSSARSRSIRDLAGGLRECAVSCLEAGRADVTR